MTNKKKKIKTKQNSNTSLTFLIYFNVILVKKFFSNKTKSMTFIDWSMNMKDSKDNKKNTRSNKYDKERKTIKILTVAVIIAALVVIGLVVMSLFSGGDEPQEVTKESSSVIIKDTESSKQSELTSSEASSESSESESSESEESQESESVETKETEPTDENVTEAYTGDWKPVETEQEGEHTTNFNDGSQDRIEIKKAASVATGLNESDMIEWWVENSGEGQVVATVSDSAQTKNYRVYLKWVDDQGWQPTKVEQLKENDKQ